MRIFIKSIILAPALVLGAACTKDKPADPSLNADLGLAAQANTARMDSISAAERAATAAAPAPAVVAPARTTTPAKASTSPRHTASTTHRASSGSGRASSGSGTASAPSEPRTVTQKNTKRDAAIGAGAGAIIGAATSHDKLKGAVIGGAAGAILGGVIGNNVDVKKKPAP